MYARGAIVGLTRGSTRAHIARAVLEGIAYQVSDLIDTMELDTGRPISELRVDGGASVSNIMMQFQSDLIAKPIDRPRIVETTALGAAFLAGLSAGVWGSEDELLKLRRSERVFRPAMAAEQAAAYKTQWKRAVQRSAAWEK